MLQSTFIALNELNYVQILIKKNYTLYNITYDICFFLNSGIVILGLGPDRLML